MKMSSAKQEKVEERIKCPDCGSEDIITTVSDMVCRNCGTCIDKIYVATHFISHTEGERMGSPCSMRGKTTTFKHKDIKPGAKREKFSRLYKVENSSYDAIEEHRSRFLLIFDRLGLNENEKNHLMNQIKQKYRALKRANKKVSNIFLIAAVLTIRYLKRMKRPESIGDVVKIFKEQNCKLSTKAVRDYIIENGITYQTSKPVEWVEKHITKIKNDSNIQNKLVQLRIEKIDFDILLTKVEKMAMKLANVKADGRKASVLSASCIFLAGELIGNQLTGAPLFTKEDISRSCGVPTTTVRNHYNYLKSMLAQ